MIKLTALKIKNLIMGTIDDPRLSAEERNALNKWLQWNDNRPYREEYQNTIIIPGFELAIKKAMLITSKK